MFHFFEGRNCFLYFILDPPLISNIASHKKLLKLNVLYISQVHILLSIRKNAQRYSFEGQITKLRLETQNSNCIAVFFNQRVFLLFRVFLVNVYNMLLQPNSGIRYCINTIFLK